MTTVDIPSAAGPYWSLSPFSVHRAGGDGLRLWNRTLRLLVVLLGLLPLPDVDWSRSDTQPQEQVLQTALLGTSAAHSLAGLDLRKDSWLGRDASGDGHTRGTRTSGDYIERGSVNPLIPLGDQSSYDRGWTPPSLVSRVRGSPAAAARCGASPICRRTLGLASRQWPGVNATSSSTPSTSPPSRQQRPTTSSTRR